MSFKAIPVCDTRINNDPKVIEFLRGPLTISQVNDFIPAANKHQESLGYTVWATELKQNGALIGFIGFNNPDFFSPSNLPFSPCVEIAWRLGSQYWGKGYATEGAKACLSYGFNMLGFSEVVSFTVPQNTRSMNLMEKIGLNRDKGGDFLHPMLPIEHPLSNHVLYRLKKEDYLKQGTNE
jgi:RimJ/RimL family protein N-acetyltransferase